MKKIKYVFTADMIDLINSKATLEDRLRDEVQYKLNSFLECCLGDDYDPDDFYLLYNNVSWDEVFFSIEIYPSTLAVENADVSRQLVYYSVTLKVDLKWLLDLAKERYR